MSFLWRMFCFTVVGVLLAFFGDLGDYGWLVVGVTLGALPLAEPKPRS